MMMSSPTPGSQAEFVSLVALAHGEHRAGRLAEAAEAYRKILAIRPDLPEMHVNLGSVRLGQGTLDDAAFHFEQALAIAPHLLRAISCLGDIRRRQGKLDEAAAYYERAVALDPNLFRTHFELGNIHWEKGQLDRARERYQTTIALRPDFADAHNNLASVLHGQGKLEQAVAHYQRAVDLRPDCAEAYNNLGNVLYEQGKLGEALATYDRALALSPDYAEVHCVRSDLKTFRAGDVDLATLEALAAGKRPIPPAKMLYVHFALGKALEDVGEYGRAFEHLLQGNALKRRQVEYNEAERLESFRLTAELFGRELLTRLAGMGDPSPAPIFVLGMARSGSTLVEQILASHPQVYAAGELNDLHRLARALPFPQCLRTLDAAGLRRIGEAYLAGLPTLPDGKTRITDKLPMNFAYIGLIRLVLPNARIIHTVRDPVDTCVSCFSRLFQSGMPHSYNLAELGRYYRGYHELMAHWRSILPADDMLEIVYEDVVDDLEQQARRLIDFCGLPWDDRCLKFHETSRRIVTSSNAQVRRPLYRDSLARWRRYETFLQPLLTEIEGCRGSIRPRTME